jgi:hypothetical protein
VSYIRQKYFPLKSIIFMMFFAMQNSMSHIEKKRCAATFSLSALRNADFAIWQIAQASKVPALGALP